MRDRRGPATIPGQPPGHRRTRPAFRGMRRTLCCLLTLAGLAGGDAAPARPYVMWSAQELAELRARHAAGDPAWTASREAAQRIDGGSSKRTNRPILSLLRAAVMQDAQAIAAERKALGAFAGFVMPGNGTDNPNERNRAWREDRTLDALRYDALHGILDADERARIEARARELIEWCIANPGPWSPASDAADAGAIAAAGGATVANPRTRWLPNMQWPTMAGAHVWAVALGDAALIERLFNADGGWKWYFDHYLADDFYMEEFAKYYSNIGSMLWWCEGLSRLGLDRFGWGYTSPSGNSMRGHLRSLLRASLPLTRRDDGSLGLSAVHMGDAGREWLAMADGQDLPRWSQSTMNGAVSKMRQALWWELGWKRFPEDGYGYLLNLMGGTAGYVPSPWWAITAPPATAPAPSAASLVTRARGFALLRSDETPASWTSGAPALAVQFGMYYVHYVHDAFSILDFAAGGRRLYDKVGGVRSGYAGNDPWRDHGRGQAGAVVVDDLQAAFVDSGEEGARRTRVRDDLRGPAKVVAIRSDGIYPQVAYERGWMLTRDYALDVADLSSETPRIYDWHVVAMGEAAGDAPWREAEELPLDALRRQRFAQRMGGGPADADQRRSPTGFLSGLHALPSTTAAWQQRFDHPTGIGVRVWMLGGEETWLSRGGAPRITGTGAAPTEAATKLIATRNAAQTRFVAVHEPTRPGAAALRSVEALATTRDGTLLRIAGERTTDLAVIRIGEDLRQPAAWTADDGTHLVLASHAWIRISPDGIDAWGDIRTLRLRAAQLPAALRINGTEARFTADGGTIAWSAPADR